MPSVADLKEQLKNQLADFDNRVKELNASKPGRAKEREGWLKDRQKELAEINANAARRIAELNNEYNQRFKDFDKDTTNERNARQRDINNERDAASKRRMQEELARWNQERAVERANLVKEQQSAIASTNANKTSEINNKNNEIKQYNTDYTSWVKDIDAQIAQAAKDKAAFNTTQNQAIAKRGVIETQAKPLGIDPDEYEQILANKDQYKQLKQEYQPYISQLTENKTRDAAIAQIAAAQKIDPSILKNYFQQKEITPLYEAAQRAQQEAQARAKAEAQAQAQRQAQQQAMIQQYADEAAQLAQKRKSENYAQMYNLLTSNMPIPVGYAQPATSRQALTTTIGAGGEDQMPMRQMSPAQIAQMATMQRGIGQGIVPQGVPLPPQLMQQLAQQQAAQQQAQQTPQVPQGAQPAKRGGIMGKF